jgi:hypothetical protein
MFLTISMLSERLDYHRAGGQRKHVTTNNVTADQAIITGSVATGGAAAPSAASPALLAVSSDYTSADA